MAVSMKPIVLSTDGKEHQQLPAGATISGDDIDKASLVSTDAGNIISTGKDGKLVATVEEVVPADLVSKDIDNVVKVDDLGKLKVAATDVAKDIVAAVTPNALYRTTDNRLAVRSISSATNNVLTTGVDGGAQLQAHDLVSTSSLGNCLTVAEADKKLMVDVNSVLDKVKDNITIVSKDANNILVAGSDKGAYLNKDAVGGGYTAGQGIVFNNNVISANVGSGLKISATNQIAVDADLDALKHTANLVYKVVDKTSEEAIKATQSNYGVVQFATDAEIKGGVAGKAVDASQLAAVKESVSTAYRYKGSVENYADLPTENVTNGDVYNVVNKYGSYPAGTNFAAVVADGTITWDALGGSIDSSDFVTKAGNSDVTGIITVPTPTTTSATKQVVNRDYVDTKVAEIIKTIDATITMVDGGAADVDVDGMANNTIVFYRADDNFTAS